MELAFPEIADPEVSTAVAVVAKPAGAIDLTKIDLADVALAQFGPWREEVKKAQERAKDVAWDVSTAKGLDDVRDFRHKVAKVPRADANKTADALVTKLTQVSKKVRAEQALIVEAWDALAAPLTALIDEREEQLATEKAERERKEAERIEAHQARLATVRGYVALAQGLPSDRIANGIASVEAIVIDPAAWDEFYEEAVGTQAGVIAKLREMHAAAKRAEDEKAESERRRRIIDALTTIQRHALECLGKPSEFIAERVLLMADTVYSEELGLVVTEAHEAALEQLRALLDSTRKQEDLQRRVDEARVVVPVQVEATAQPESPSSEPEKPLYAPLRDLPTQAEQEAVREFAFSDVPVPAEPKSAPEHQAASLLETHATEGRTETHESPPLPTLKLGDINVRLAPLSVTASALSMLGFEPAGSAGAAKLYHEATFVAIVDALIAHLQALKGV